MLFRTAGMQNIDMYPARECFTYLGLAAVNELARLRVLMCLKPACWSVLALVMLVLLF